MSYWCCACAMDSKINSLKLFSEYRQPVPRSVKVLPCLPKISSIFLYESGDDFRQIYCRDYSMRD